MRESDLRAILDEAGIEPLHVNLRKWIVAKCPFAEYLHERGTDNSPSFNIKIDEHGRSAFKCFHGDTRYLTIDGVKTFRDTVGTTQMVLAPTGSWTPARILHFGRQPLLRVSLSRCGVEKEILATEGHRWFTRRKHNGKDIVKERTTAQLRKGHALARVFPEARGEFCAEGFLHGVVFGDGTLAKKMTGYGTVRLFGEKRQLAEVLGQSSKVTCVREIPEGHYADYPAHTRVAGHFAGLKQLPPLTHSDDYLLSFAYGYFATDGHLSTHASISSACKENLLGLRDILSRVGIGSYGVRESVFQNGYSTAARSMAQMTLLLGTLRADMLLRTDQRAALVARGAIKERLGFRVTSIEVTGTVDDVFCASVPGYGAFALEDNILTGNCFTCKRHGSIRSLVSQLGWYRGEDLRNLALRAELAEIPDRFPDFEAEAERMEAPEPINASLYLAMYPLAWEEAECRGYLAKRGIGQRTAETLSLRYDPERKRVVFPVFGFGGNLFGLTGRSIVSDIFRSPSVPKIKNYAGLRKEFRLLGEQLIEPGKPLLVVEGLFGLARAIECGVCAVCNPVAIMGSDLSDAQRDLLLEYDQPVYLCLDNDHAGNVGLFGQYDAHAGRWEGGGAIDKLKPHTPVRLCAYPARTDDVDKLTPDEWADMIRNAELA